MSCHFMSLFEQVPKCHIDAGVRTNSDKIWASPECESLRHAAGIPIDLAERAAHATESIAGTKENATFLR